MALKGFTEDTPLEVYKIRGREVHVKRDDLMGDDINLPPWGKIGAVYHLAKKLVDKSKPLAHLSVDGSWTAWVLGAVAEDLGIEFYAAYPDSKKISHDYLHTVLELYPNTNLYPIEPNMMQIMYNSLKRDSKEKGWQMLPFAFDHEIYRQYLIDRISPISNFDNLVVASGSGVTLTGLARGFYTAELESFFVPNITKKVWTTCVSSENSIRKMLTKSGIPPHFPIDVRKSEYDFNDRLDGYEAPFPCNQFWDIKQWKWLEDNIEKIEGSVLFWNLGGKYKF